MRRVECMGRRRRIAAVRAAVALAMLVWTSTAAGQKLLPVDEGPRQPDFFGFRSRLMVAIARRDTAALYAAIDPRIRVSFGDDNGIDVFKRRWLPGSPTSRIWKELAAVLSLGGQFRSEDQFVAPYVHSSWPDSRDAFEYVAVTASRVNVRSAPSASAAVVGTLTFEVVALDTKADRPELDSAWRAVKTSGGRTGYVAAEFVRSSVGYRAFFQRTGRVWRMSLLVAGD